MLSKKILSLILCLSLLLAIPFPVAQASSYSPADGEFVFSSSDMLSYFTNPHSIDLSFDSGEKAAKLVVNNDYNASDPQLLLNLTGMNPRLKASDFKSLLIIYRVPVGASSKALQTELFISSGTVTGPTAGKSVMYNISKSDSYSTQIVDLSSLSWWSGNIHSIRVDSFTNASVGDTMYIDSIIFCADQNEAISIRDQRMSERYNTSTPGYNGTDYVCTSYQYDKYTSPIWKGNIVYNEAVYPVKDANGNSVYTLMYTPDEITSVYSSDFSSCYYEGIDYVVNGNKITFLQSGGIRLKDYTYIHPQSNPYNYSWDRYYKRTAAGDGKWEYWGQSDEFFNGYINVTYTHSDTWDHYVPQQKSSQLPRTSNVISNKGSMNVVFFGDSICGGANSSSYRKVYPYAEFWNEMIVSKLTKDYGCKINATYSAEGGGAAPDLVNKTEEWVNAYSPDLVFIEFGVNDAMNWSQDSNGSAAGLKSEFKTAIKNIINKVRQSYPNCEFVLVAPFYSNPYCHYMSYFEACRDALNELAASYSGVIVADITSMHKSLMEFKDYLDFSGDNMCHPNDFMARIYAQVCLEAIVPGGISAYTVNTEEPPVAEPDVGNTSLASPGGYGWQWPSQEAYGYIGNYGGNGQDIEFTCDLSLMSSGGEEAVAIFYTEDGTNIDITPTSISVGNRTFAYDWGVADISNWHTIKIKIKNGAASVYVDGELVGSVSSGVVAHTTYQLFFSYTACMAIDNMKMKSSAGTVYFDCNFENESTANSLMGSGYGKRTLLAANTVSYNTNGGNGTFPNQIKVKGYDLTLTSEVPTKNGYTFLGWATSKNATTAKYTSGSLYTADSSVTLYAVWKSNSVPDPEPVYPTITSITPKSNSITDTGKCTFTVVASGDGLKYSWSCSESALTPYLSGTNSATLVVNIPELLAKEFSATLKCKVTNSEGNSVTSDAVTLKYSITPAPTLDSITPTSTSITDTGSVSFTASATGDGLTYKWTCSNSSLIPYVTGINTKTITVNIPEILENELTATFTCVVTGANGLTSTAKSASFTYSITPPPQYTSGDLNDDGIITASDLNILKRMVVGITAAEPDSILFLSADLNSDGFISAKDVSAILKLIIS